jgi:diguanylate cyclase (GGDEF)-like protein
VKRIVLGRNSIILIAITLFFLLASANEYMYFLERQHRDDQFKRELLAHASTLRASLEREINTTLNLTMGLIVYISTHPDLSETEFSAIARNLMQSAPHIRNIGLAKDNVITHMYPLKGNEAALGLRYLDHPKQRDAVLRAIETHHAVIAGPVDLVQGGQGFISRIPIYTGQNFDTYWGLASIVINLDDFYRAAGLDYTFEALQVALRGKDAMGISGEVFYGDAALFGRSDAVIMPIKLPEGEWVLAVAPGRDSKTLSSLPDTFRVLGYIAAGAIALLLYILLKAIRRNRFLALHDPLTGLANRRLFNEELANAIETARYRQSCFALLYIDLDGFKPVNDTYGHDAGDQLLMLIAKRLASRSRPTDRLARVGGDEFVVILQDVDSIEQARKAAEKLCQSIEEPMSLPAGTTLQIKASVGISLYPDDGRSADALITHADSVMYRAKTQR